MIRWGRVRSTPWRRARAASDAAKGAEASSSSLRRSPWSCHSTCCCARSLTSSSASTVAACSRALAWSGVSLSSPQTRTRSAVQARQLDADVLASRAGQRGLGERAMHGERPLEEIVLRRECLVQPAVLDRDRALGGERRDQGDLDRLEVERAAAADVQRAHHLLAREHRRAQHRTDPLAQNRFAHPVRGGWRAPRQSWLGRRRFQPPLQASAVLSGVRASKRSATARRCCSRNSVV